MLSRLRRERFIPQDQTPAGHTSGGIPAAEEKTGRLVSRPSARQPDGKGNVAISGDLKQWHKVTLTLDGPFAHESDGSGGISAAGNAKKQSDGRLEARPSNPFTDCRFNVTFTHESGAPSYLVPGYFAADGNAAESGADAGTKWRAHLAPDKAGRWTWSVQFLRGPNVAVGPVGENAAQPVAPYDGKSGEFTIAPTDKTGRDFRANGRLRYVGKHHLQFAGSGEYFLIGLLTLFPPPFSWFVTARRGGRPHFAFGGRFAKKASNRRSFGSGSPTRVVAREGEQC